MLLPWWTPSTWSTLLLLYITLEKSRLTDEVFRAFDTLMLWNSHFWASTLKYSWRPSHWCINYQCRPRTDIDEAKVISARHKSKFNFELFWQNILIFGFSCCNTRVDLSIDVSITNVGLMFTKLWWFLFSGYGQTDTHCFGILTWKHVGTQKISTSSKLVVCSASAQGKAISCKLFT